LTKYDVPSISTSSCDHANIIEENARLKNKLAKSSIPIGDKNLNDILSNQMSKNVKIGLGYVSKAKKKNNNKNKTKPAEAKNNLIMGCDATRGKTTHDDFAGITNHQYVLFS
jgi:hypothetical protein